MTMIAMEDIPPNLVFCQEWRRIVFNPKGDRVATHDSQWYEDEQMARALLNDEYPEPTATGYRFRLQERWVSEFRMVDP